MNGLRRLADRLRKANPDVVDGLIALVFVSLGLVSAFAQDVSRREGARDASAAMIATVIIGHAPVALRRRAPFIGLVISAVAVLVHFLIGWPEGILPLAALLLTYSVGVKYSLRVALAALALVAAVIITLGLSDSPGLDTVGAFGVVAQFSAAWALGVALRSRRVVADAAVREADERAEADRQTSARLLAEERLRIAQELHDVLAHSMSVIAVQAGVGAHVLDERPAEARAALDAISATSRGTLNEMRRLLGALRDSDGVRAHVPAPGLGDLPQLVQDVRAAGVPVTLHVEGELEGVRGGVELSVYRVVQEALTNVIKHAGATTRVDVTVRHQPGSLAVEIVDDGRGLAARSASGSSATSASASASASSNGGPAADGSGHGLVGMRERVELWGGELSTGPAPGGGYRVRALIPYGDSR